MERMCVRVKEACQLLSIGRTSLYKLDIPYSKINGVRVYQIKDLELYLNSHKVVNHSYKLGGAV